MTEEKKEEASENLQNTSDKQSEEIPTFAKTDTEKVEPIEDVSDEIDEISEDTQYLRKTLHRTQRNQKLLIGAVCLDVYKRQLMQELLPHSKSMLISKTVARNFKLTSKHYGNN